MNAKKENTDKKQWRTASTLFYIVATIDFIVALSYFIGDGDTSLGIMWMCIGSTFLCLGAAGMKKWNDTQPDTPDEEKDNEENED